MTAFLKSAWRATFLVACVFALAPGVRASVDDAQSFALQAAEPYVKEGYQVREDYWGGDLGSGEISNGSIGADGTFRFTSTVTYKGGTEEATFLGTLEGNAIRGRVQVVGNSPGNFTGTRPERGQGRPPRTPQQEN